MTVADGAFAGHKPAALAQGPKESVADRLRRYALGVAWSLKPPRVLGVPATLLTLAAHYAGGRLRPGQIPDPEGAWAIPDGLAGVCTDLRPETVVSAYAHGLYTFCHLGPMKWWAPASRMVLKLEDFHMEKNLRRKLRQKEFHVTFDRDFFGVLEGCARPRPGRWHLTWITPHIAEIFGALFEAGHAHSVEVYDLDGELVGGAYGVAAGGAFFTESQFSRKRDASKVGFATLNCHLQNWGFRLNDGKHKTAHLEQFGFRPASRRAFNAMLAETRSLSSRPGRWSVDPALDVAAWKPAERAVPVLA